MGAAKLIAIIVVSLFVFTGAVLFLLWFFRDRFVPRIPDSARDPEEDAEEDSGYAVPSAGLVRPSRAVQERPERTPQRTAFQAAESYGDDDDYEDEYDFDEEIDETEEAQAASFEAPEAADSEPQTAHLQDVLDCIYLPGRRLSECGIPESFISEDSAEVPVDGDLFGSYAYGGLTLSEDGGEDPVIESFYIIGTDPDFAGCRVKLTERFGEAVSEGEQESEDGAKTEFAGFATDYGTLWLSRGAGNSYVNINFT